MLVTNRAAYVREALKAGRPVPAHVRADFPELAAQHIDGSTGMETAPHF
jgi:hypothetical protein